MPITWRISSSVRGGGGRAKNQADIRARAERQPPDFSVTLRSLSFAELKFAILETTYFAGTLILQRFGN